MYSNGKDEAGGAHRSTQALGGLQDLLHNMLRSAEEQRREMNELRVSYEILKEEVRALRESQSWGCKCAANPDARLEKDPRRPSGRTSPVQEAGLAPASATRARKRDMLYSQDGYEACVDKFYNDFAPAVDEGLLTDTSKGDSSTQRRSAKQPTVKKEPEAVRNMRQSAAAKPALSKTREHRGGPKRAERSLGFTKAPPTKPDNLQACGECRPVWLGLCRGNEARAAELQRVCGRQHKRHKKPDTPPHWNAVSFPETPTQAPPFTQRPEVDLTPEKDPHAG